MLDTIADIRSRLGTCNQRDADAATLLGIVDSLLASEARMRAVLEGILGIINKTHGVDGWNLNGEIATWEQLGYPEEIESVLSVPPGPVAELVEAVAEIERQMVNPNNFNTPGEESRLGMAIQWAIAVRDKVVGK